MLSSGYMCQYITRSASRQEISGPFLPGVAATSGTVGEKEHRPVRKARDRYLKRLLPPSGCQAACARIKRVTRNCHSIDDSHCDSSCATRPDDRVRTARIFKRTIICEKTKKLLDISHASVIMTPGGYQEFSIATMLPYVTMGKIRIAKRRKEVVEAQRNHVCDAPDGGHPPRARFFFFQWRM